MSFSSATLGLNVNSRRKGDVASDFNSKVDHILQKRLGIGLKILEIEYCGYNADTCCYLNRWLAITITPACLQLRRSTFSHCHFYLMGVEIRFGIYGLLVVPSAAQDLIA
jgi:hypothetical protein